MEVTRIASRGRRHHVALSIVGLVAAGWSPAAEYRTVDGTGNNPLNPAWGSAHTALVRHAPSDYSDGISEPAGSGRASARVISNAVAAQVGSIPNTQAASDFVWQWGQFLDHDIDLTEAHDPAPPSEEFDIPVPPGDPFFDPDANGGVVIPMARSQFVAGTVPRQQVNAITAFIDASNVYGSDSVRSQALRTLDGTGRLRVDADGFLPRNTEGLPNAGTPGVDPAELFLAGDVRANEQVGLTAMHVLFVREHNRQADALLAAEPGLTGDEVYFQARRTVGALMQSITYREFLPALLGEGAIGPYDGYDISVDPGIRNAFSTAAFRLGHSMLSATLQRLDDSGASIPEGPLALRDAFFSPDRLTEEGGIDPVLRGLASQLAQQVDPFVIDDVRNFLFGPPGAGGFDLASLNIQRGRDHGLPSYNQLRADYGLAPVTDVMEITSDPLIGNALEDVYPNVDAIDAWVGALAEDHVPGALVGELVSTILVEQFEALRAGDRLWYERELTPEEIDSVEATTLADVIRRNTDIETIADDVFHVAAPPQSLAHTLDPSYALLGAPLDVVATGAQPGETVLMFASLAGVGSGPCAPTNPSFCLDLAPPVVTLGQATADAGGVAVLTIDIPGTLASADLHTQVIARRGPDDADSVKSFTLATPVVEFGPTEVTSTLSNRADPGDAWRWSYVLRNLSSGTAQVELTTFHARPDGTTTPLEGPLLMTLGPDAFLDERRELDLTGAEPGDHRVQAELVDPETGEIFDSGSIRVHVSGSADGEAARGGAPRLGPDVPPVDLTLDGVVHPGESWSFQYDLQNPSGTPRTVAVDVLLTGPSGDTIVLVREASIEIAPGDTQRFEPSHPFDPEVEQGRHTAFVRVVDLEARTVSDSTNVKIRVVDP